MQSQQGADAAYSSTMLTIHADHRVIACRLSRGRSACNIFELRAVDADIDHMGHVNNAVYLSWVQDVVVKHWTALASDVELAAYLWVAVKHEITYRRPAFLGDVLRATVIATGFQGARAMFDTVIRRGDLVIAEVKSVWCSLDAASKRPKRVAQEIVRRFTTELPVG